MFSNIVPRKLCDQFYDSGRVLPISDPHQSSKVSFSLQRGAHFHSFTRSPFFGRQGSTSLKIEPKNVAEIIQNTLKTLCCTHCFVASFLTIHLLRGLFSCNVGFGTFWHHAGQNGAKIGQNQAIQKSSDPGYGNFFKLFARNWILEKEKKIFHGRVLVQPGHKEVTHQASRVLRLGHGSSIAVAASRRGHERQLGPGDGLLVPRSDPALLRGQPVSHHAVLWQRRWEYVLLS